MQSSTLLSYLEILLILKEKAQIIYNFNSVSAKEAYCQNPSLLCSSDTLCCVMQVYQGKNDFFFLIIGAQKRQFK